MGLISDSMRDAANHMSIIDYCNTNGIEIKKSGHAYILVDHDSCRIDADNPWRFYWHSHQIGGKAIDFVMEYETYILGNPITFPEAVFKLIGPVSQEPTIANSVPAKILNRDIKDDYRRVVAYLCKQRGLDYSIVKQLIDEHKLYQDSFNNCVFPLYDDYGLVCGVSLRGTGGRFHQMEGEHKGHGFEWKINDTVHGLIFFEAVIDLLSFYQLFRSRLKTCLLVALCGVKHNLIDEYHDRYPTAKIYVAFDNDNCGEDTWELVKQKYPNAVRIRVKSEYKDWNDQLLNKKKIVD